MKRTVILLLMLVVSATLGWAQYPYASIRQIQQVPAESLAVADTLPNFSANSTQARWTLQTSPFWSSDTVTTTALVVVPPGVITYTSGIWTMLLYDTTSGIDKWGGVLLRASASDSTQLKQDGFLNVSPGDIITLTGVVSEFPSSRGFSGTQLQPLAGHPITIIGSAPLPKPIVKNIGDFYTGIFPAGKVQYAGGEPYEGMIVEFHNVTVNNKVNQGRGTFSFVDALGNELSDYDWSRYFTLGHGSSLPWPGDTAWTRIYAGVSNGLRVDTIRGVISTSSGSEGPRGYRICPMYPGDVVFGEVPAPPLVTTHRRNPVIASPDSGVVVSVRVTKQTNGASPNTISLLYSLDNASFVSVPMTYNPTDTTFVAGIPAQAAGVAVKYFVQVVDSFAQVVRLANSATSGIASDTSKGFFFYTSLDRPLTIQDVQYTPYVNGRTPYLGAQTSLSGIITADTSNIGLSPLTTGSTNAWYMQSTNQPWSGIWLTTSDSAGQSLMSALRNGDSVKVTGTVQEQFDVTRLGSITSVTKLSSGTSVPAPVVRNTVDFNVGNGTPSAEAYEGMLVRFNNVTVTDINPTFSDDREYTVNDGTGGVLVQHSGKNKYSNRLVDSGKTILKVGDKIGALTGVVYYSFNQYKFVPRTDADFQNVVITDVAERMGSDIPASYALSQNYPNPFNPSTQIQYALPLTGATTLKVYNLLGQEVATLVDEVQPAGAYTVRFDASRLSSGLYFYRVQSGTFSAVNKMMLVK